MIRNVLTFTLLVVTATAIHGAAGPRIEIAREHIAMTAVFTGPRRAAPERSPLIRRALAGRDPGTSATSFVHGIRRAAKKLLAPEQSEHWEALLAKRGPQLARLHDERNVLRAYFFACAWELPLLDPGEARAAKEKELRDWLDLWMEIRLQEQIAHHRCCREAWELLTEEQRGKLKAGDWDGFVKKSTGHARAYFGDRIVIRALGKPDREDAFASLSGELEREHAGIQGALLKAEARWRRLDFAIPSLPDAAMAQAWAPVDAAHRAFFLSQARHIDELSRAGYDLSRAETRTRAAAQPAREFAELDEKLETKLTEGKTLRALMKGASDR